MNRLCERPGCSAPAEVAYGFDADSLIVWLDAFTASQGMRHGVLCRRHADAMIVPLGWMLDDRREPTLRLFKSAAVDVPETRTRTPRRTKRKDGEQLILDGTGEITRPDTPDDGADLDDIDPPGDDATEAAWIPVFDQHDDLEGLLNARGRLLSRAFNGGSTPGS